MTHRVNEMYGLYVNGSDTPDLTDSLANQICPLTGKRCGKRRKSVNETIGTCSVLAKDSVSNEDLPMLICPDRLIEGNRIFLDCIDLISSSIPGSDLYLIPEVKTSAGRLDYVLAAFRDGHPVDFVGIELQTLDTTGSVWPNRQRLLCDLGYMQSDTPKTDKQEYSINWKMTGKTILTQIVQKGQLFETFNRHLVLICQTPLYDYMEQAFNFSEVEDDNHRNHIHFHCYDYIPAQSEMCLKLGKMKSITAEAVDRIMGLESPSNEELVAINKILEKRMKPDYLFNPFMAQ